MPVDKRKRVSNAGITPQQELVLEQRLENYGKGQMNFSKWTVVRNRIHANKKGNAGICKDEK